jgi:hypothetical protein
MGFAPLGGGEGAVDDLVRLGQRDRAHFPFLLSSPRL